jgi:hypothetical protein
MHWRGRGGARKKGSNLPRTEEKLDEVRLGSAERGGGRRRDKQLNITIYAGKHGVFEV